MVQPTQTWKLSVEKAGVRSSEICDHAVILAPAGVSSSHGPSTLLTPFREQSAASITLGFSAQQGDGRDNNIAAPNR